MNTLTLEYVQRIAEQKGLKVLHNPDPFREHGLVYCVVERNPHAHTTLWLARTLQEVFDGLQRELPRREWREAEEAAVWCWLEAEGREEMRKAGVHDKPAPESRQWWQDVGRHLQRDWAARNPDAIARWRLANQANDDDEPSP